MEDITKEVLSNDMTNSDYSILVLPYAFGQFRIQITNVKFRDAYAPVGHGSIVREL